MSDSTEEVITIASMRDRLKKENQKQDISDQSRQLLMLPSTKGWTREDVVAHGISYCAGTNVVQKKRIAHAS